MEVTIDGKETTNKDVLHSLLQVKLDLPDYYGKNLDALHDCLTSWVDMPLTINIISFEEMKLNLGEYAESFLTALKGAKEEIKGLEIKVK